MAGTKHTIPRDTNKIIHLKLVGKPLPDSFQSPLFRREKTRGEWMDGSFRCPYPHSIQRKSKTRNFSQKKMTEEKVRQQEKRRPDKWMKCFGFTPPTPIGRRRPKPIKTVYQSRQGQAI